MKKAVLLILGVLVISSLLVSGCGGPNPDKKYTKEPQEKTAEGYYVYYVKDAYFWVYQGELNLVVDTIKETGRSVYVVNIERGLLVTADPKYGGTVLIAKHWRPSSFNVIDKAELVVRTLEQKEIWEKAIQDKLEELRQIIKPQPRDVLPMGYEPPEPPKPPKPYLGVWYDMSWAGALIREVDKDSPAEKAGLQKGDGINKVNGEEVTLENDLQKIFSKYKPGDEVILTVIRDAPHKGPTITISVVLGKR